MNQFKDNSTQKHPVCLKYLILEQNLRYILITPRVILLELPPLEAVLVVYVFNLTGLWLLVQSLGPAGSFASKVKRIPLVSQFANASGAFFVLVGGLTWLSVSKLDANTVFVSETWSAGAMKLLLSTRSIEFPTQFTKTLQSQFRKQAQLYEEILTNRSVLYEAFI